MRSRGRAAIRYPFAQGPDGPVAVADYDRATTSVSCFGCDAPMIARQPASRSVRWHFAHKVDPRGACNGETALHRMAKALIVHSFRSAKAASRPYELVWNCSACGEASRADCTRRWHEAHEEETLVSDVRSDVVFLGERPFAVEVVVTHAIDEAAAARYAAAAIPVFVVRPTWDNVHVLRSRIDADCATNLDRTRCGGCAAIAARSVRAAARAETFKERLAATPIIDGEVARRAVGSWPPSADRWGRPLFARVRDALREQAVRLVALGFNPTRQNPWTFWRPLPGNIGHVCVGLGGDEFEPLWENCGALLLLDFYRPDDDVSKLEECVHRWLSVSGVEIGDCSVRLRCE